MFLCCKHPSLTIAYSFCLPFRFPLGGLLGPLSKMLSFAIVCLSFAAYVFADTSCHTLELTWKTGAPDGFERDMIFINGQFPGPVIEVQQGDWVEITVVNKMPFNTSIHAHGMYSLSQSRSFS